MDSWDTLKQAGSWLGRQVYEATPLDNIVKGYQAASSGDWGEFGRQVAGGAVDVGLILATGGAGRGAMLAGNAARGNLLRQTGSTVLNAGIPWRLGGRAITAGFAPGAGRALQIGVGGTLGGSAGVQIGQGLYSGMREGMAGQTAAPRYVSTRTPGRATPVTVAPAGAVDRRAMAEAYQQRIGGVPAGAVDRRAMAEAYRQRGATSSYGMGGPGTPAGGSAAGIGGGPIDTAIGPSPEMLYDYALEGSRLQQEYDQQMAQMEAARRMASMQTQDTLRSLGAQRAGLQADVTSALGEAGLGASPALQAVAIDEPAMEFERRRTAAMADLAGAQEQIARDRLSAERGYYGGLDVADAALVDALARIAQNRQQEIYNMSGSLI